MSKLATAVLVIALSAGSAVTGSESKGCKRYIRTSADFKEEIQKRGAKVVIGDWIDRIEADSVNHAWGCVLDAIGSADQGWLDVASLLWPASDGAAGEDLMWAFADALDSNPRVVLKHFKAHASQQLEVTCGTETLAPDRSIREVRQLLARRRGRVATIGDPDLKVTVDACLRAIEAEEKTLPEGSK
jgi:hypothetical protein